MEVNVIGAFQMLTNVLIAKITSILDKIMAIPMMENVFGYQVKENAILRNGLLTIKCPTTKTVLVILSSGVIEYDYIMLSTSENMSSIDILNFLFNS